MSTGILQTYNNTVGVPYDFEPMIHWLDPDDTPFLNGQVAVGGSALPVLPRGTATQKKHEWQDYSMLRPSSTLAATAAHNATSITVATNTRPRFMTGDLVYIPATGETVRVTGYSTDANVLNVTRSWASTAATTVPSGSEVIIVGPALPEGDNAPVNRFTVPTARYNLTQIFQDSVKISGTDDVVTRFGMPSRFAFDLMSRTKEMAIKVEQAIRFGVRHDDNGSLMTRSMGGLVYYLTAANGATVDNTTKTLSEPYLLDMMQAIWTAGGKPSVVALGAVNKRIVSGFTTSGTVQVARADNQRGAVVTQYISDFGSASIVLDRYAGTQFGFVFDREMLEFTQLRPFFVKPLAETGDHRSVMLVWEPTLTVRRAAHGGIFNALNTQ